MRSTTYFWLALMILVAAVLIAGFEKYRAQHLRSPRHQTSFSLDQLTPRATGRAPACAAAVRSFCDAVRLAVRA